MKIILLKEVDRLGEKYDVVEVKNGFGRNFLIPQKLAVIANRPNMNKLRSLKEAEDVSKIDVKEPK